MSIALLPSEKTELGIYKRIKSLPPVSVAASLPMFSAATQQDHHEGLVMGISWQLQLRPLFTSSPLAAIPACRAAVRASQRANM